MAQKKTKQPKYLGSMVVVVNTLRAFQHQTQQYQQKDRHNVEDYVVNNLTSPDARIIEDYTTNRIRYIVHKRYERALYFTQNTHKLAFTIRAGEKYNGPDEHILATLIRFAQVFQCNMGDTYTIKGQ